MAKKKKVEAEVAPVEVEAAAVEAPKAAKKVAEKKQAAPKKEAVVKVKPIKDAFKKVLAKKDKVVYSGKGGVLTKGIVADLIWKGDKASVLIKGLDKAVAPEKVVKLA